MNRKTLFNEELLETEVSAKPFTFFLFLLLEIFYVGISLIVYRNDIVYSFEKTPSEISFWIANYTPTPTQYLELWAFIPKFFTIGIFQFYLLQKAIDFLIFLNSSFILIYSLIKGYLKESKTQSQSFSLIILYSILGSLLISFNPLYVNLFFKFGVGYLALLNFSLYFFYRSFKIERKIVSFSYIIISTFLLILSYNSYPLVIIYYVFISFFLFLPIAVANKNIARFFVSFGTSISLFIFISFGVLSDIVPSYGLSKTFSTEPIFHVLNLIYYTFKTNGELISLTGMNTFFVPTDYRITEILIIILIIVLIYLYFKVLIPNKNLSLIYLGFSFTIIQIFNAYLFNGFTLYNFLIYLIVKSHIVTYNHFGLLLTPTDFDRLILIVFWYVLSTIIVLSLVSFMKYLETTYFPCKKFDTKVLINKSKLNYTGSSKKIRFLFTFFLTFVILFASVQILSYSDNFAPSESNSLSFGIVSSPFETNYDSCLYLPEPNFVSSHVYPYTITPTSEDYSYYMALINAQSSPIFSTFYNSSPANVYIHTNQIYNCEQKNFVHLGSNYFVSKNFNMSNIKTGNPTIYTGSENSYETYLINELSSTVNGTVLKVEGPSNQNISYTKIPNYINCLGNKKLIEFSVTLNMSSWSGSGGFLIGVASNASDSYGYGVNNIFYGLGGISYNNNSNTVQFQLTFSNSSKWEQVGGRYIQAGRLHSNINVKMYLGKSGNNYFFFWNILNKWYVSPAFKNGGNLRYITFHDFLNSNNNVNYSIVTSEIAINDQANILPIFSDSYFGDFSNFMNVINNTNNIINSNCCSPQFNLAESALVWNKSTNVIEPSAYSIENPNSGWFQVFNNQPPQGSYYSEGIASYLLPIQTGYGDYRGYAESILANSSVKIPIKEQLNGKLSLYLLFSPLGGQLEIKIGGHNEYINTYSNSSNFKWISFNISFPFNGIKLINLNGTQSINLITFANYSLFNGVCNDIKDLLIKKTQNNVSSIKEKISISTTSKFKPSIGNNVINFNSSNYGEFGIVLPENVNYGLEVKSLNSNAHIIPVWGNYLGILVNNISERNLTLNISSQNISLIPIIVFYSMPFTAVFFIFVANMKKKNKLL